jgi:hypothetical protein
MCNFRTRIYYTKEIINGSEFKGKLMYELVTIDNPSYEQWTQVLDNATEGNYQQSYEFGEVMKRAFSRTNVIRLAALHDEQPVGILQGTYRKRLWFGGQMIVPGISGGAPLSCAKEETEKKPVIRELLEALEKHAKRNHIIEARVYWTEFWGMQDVFDQLNYKLGGNVNAFRVDLRKSVEELWQSISHNFRRKIRQAMREQVEIVEAKDIEDVRLYHKMVTASGDRKQFGPPPLEEYEAIWDIYRPKNMAKIFLARWKGKYVAGTQVIAHRKTLQATSAGSFKEGWPARPSDFLHWKIMEWAIQKGFWYYNLGGAFSPTLIQWKKEFNANTENIQKYDKVFFPKMKSTIGRVYGAAMAAKRLFR